MRKLPHALGAALLVAVGWGWRLSIEVHDLRREIQTVREVVKVVVPDQTKLAVLEERIAGDEERLTALEDDYRTAQHEAGTDPLPRRARGDTGRRRAQ